MCRWSPWTNMIHLGSDIFFAFRPSCDFSMYNEGVELWTVFIIIVSVDVEFLNTIADIELVKLVAILYCHYLQKRLWEEIRCGGRGHGEIHFDGILEKTSLLCERPSLLILSWPIGRSFVLSTAVWCWWALVVFIFSSWLFLFSRSSDMVSDAFYALVFVFELFIILQIVRFGNLWSSVRCLFMTAPRVTKISVILAWWVPSVENRSVISHCYLVMILSSLGISLLSSV